MMWIKIDYGYVNCILTCMKCTVNVRARLHYVHNNGPGSNNTNRNNSPVSMSILTRALNAFDIYASNLSIDNALKFKRSLSLSNAAEMFLQFNDAEKQGHIQEVLESNSVLML